MRVFLRPQLPQVALAVLLGDATVVSNGGLLATAAYVISAAVLVPFLGTLVIPIYLVRLSGVLGPVHAKPSAWSPRS
jgi:hypothetical protein